MKIFKQETSKSCGIACLRSILNYYGNNFSERDVWAKHKSFQQKEGGILNPIPSLGVTALKFGFDVTYIGYNPIIANNNALSDIRESLKKKSKTFFDYGKFYVDEALKFLELGGKIKIEKLNIEKIKKLLDKYKFALVEIRPIFVSNKGTNFGMHHKIILEGYTKKGFKALNPSNAKAYVIDYDSFLMAFYSACGELLIIQRKN